MGSLSTPKSRNSLSFKNKQNIQIQILSFIVDSFLHIHVWQKQLISSFAFIYDNIYSKNISESNRLQIAENIYSPANKSMCYFTWHLNIFILFIIWAYLYMILLNLTSLKSTGKCELTRVYLSLCTSKRKNYKKLNKSLEIVINGSLTERHNHCHQVSVAYFPIY